MSQAVLIVISVILTAAVAFLGWLAHTVYQLSMEFAAIAKQVSINTSDIKDIQRHGSPALQRIEERLNNLADGQERIEKSIGIFHKEEHKRHRQQHQDGDTTT